MTAAAPRIEDVGDHEYLVRIDLDEDIVTVRVRATPAVIADASGTEADEQRVVAATVDYLTARQRADDLPAELDLDDVVAAYDGYIDHLRETLAHHG